MQVIYKYRLEWSPVQIVKLPLKRLLTIQLQDGTPCLWALVDTNAPELPITVCMAGTGTYDGYSYEQLEYINTTQYGAIMLHWFYEPPKGAGHAGT